ncbi:MULTISPECIES: hypothetical protein [unclassified Halorubrum]|uniref:hypothetical protein n=1 Tax=unclassified Halorubrum TaxID=2642239 RepID=UPI000B985125|nr:MULTISPECIES: hypothetical protein [unclassified Halorubrum]OYR43395.1 hypothetical protein DJ81_09485 [Halorubrum sp. Hd13]OYR49074.1 hypothetical protein DJ74_09160 [Halorubrum sp. Ea8]
MTPKQIATDGRIDLSVGAIEAFADGDYHPTDQEEVDLQAVVRSLSDGGRREIQTVDDARNAIRHSPENEKPEPKDEAPVTSASSDQSASAENGEPAATGYEQVDDDLEDSWSGIVDAEVESGNHPDDVESDNEIDSVFMDRYGSESAGESYQQSGDEQRKSSD